MASINEDSNQENSQSVDKEELFQDSTEINDGKSNERKCFCYNLSNDSDEQKRLGHYQALHALLRQSLGPLCSMLHFANSY